MKDQGCYVLPVFVCLSACSHDPSKSYERILMKIFGGVGYGTIDIRTYCYTDMEVDSEQEVDRRKSGLIT